MLSLGWKIETGRVHVFHAIGHMSLGDEAKWMPIVDTAARTHSILSKNTICRSIISGLTSKTAPQVNKAKQLWSVLEITQEIFASGVLFEIRSTWK